MKHKPLPLTEDEVLKLEEIVRKGADWRSRDRATTLLLLSRGEPAKIHFITCVYTIHRAMIKTAKLAYPDTMGN